MRISRRRWQDFTPTQQASLLTLAAIQLSLAATAWVDLARRPAQNIYGKKSMWAAIIAINFVGPITYFVKGIRR